MPWVYFKNSNSKFLRYGLPSKLKSGRILIFIQYKVNADTSLTVDGIDNVEVIGSAVVPGGYSEAKLPHT